MAESESLLERLAKAKPGYVVTPAVRTGQVIAEYDINLVAFKIYGSQVLTIERAEKKLFDHKTLINCYHYLTDDNRLALPLNACRAVVLGEITRIWYEVSGFELPAGFHQRQEARMAKAKETTAQAEAAAAENGAATKTKEPRITNRSIIEAGLLAGKSDDEIMAEVKAQFPNGKADQKHIGYYRHYLVKGGQLEKQPRKPRAKKAGDTAEGAQEAANAPVPTKVSAAKGTATPAAKAAPAKAAPAKAKAGK